MKILILITILLFVGCGSERTKKGQKNKYNEIVKFIKPMCIDDKSYEEAFDYYKRCRDNTIYIEQYCRNITVDYCREYEVQYNMKL